MAAKEPTVERRHELLAEEALGPAEALFQGEYSEAIDRVAQALAAAEQAAAEAERAAVTAWLYQELGDAADQLAIDINLGEHVRK